MDSAFSIPGFLIGDAEGVFCVYNIRNLFACTFAYRLCVYFHILRIGGDSMKEKLGLVFGGGGGKGAYQIGVWRALHEAGIDKKIDSVSGTSIGALNGALFCMENLSGAEKVWSSISQEQILTKQDVHLCCKCLPQYNESVFTDGWFSNAGLKKLIDSAVDFRVLKNGDRDFFVTAAKLQKRPRFYNFIKCHSQDNIFTRGVSLWAIRFFKYQTVPMYFDIRKEKTVLIPDILLASSAIPLIFPDVTIESDTYVDGGIEDNVPIAPLYQKGIRKYIVITMEKRDKTCMTCFTDARFVHINLEESTLQNFTGTLDFNPQNAIKRIEQGYRDGMRSITQIWELL